ncbi:MAG: carbonate dehydratase [Chthoniobacterales bacterium]
MEDIKKLFVNNRLWAAEIERTNPGIFKRLSQQQAPKFLWIGCADSRVPANEIVGLDPGELFVHRNVANVVVHADLNCLSVIQFAVDVLKVEHIIVTGHYGCGGVRAALKGQRVGLADNWLRHVQDVRLKHQASLEELTTDECRCDRLCELNVIEQVINVCQTTVVEDAWERGQELAVHGFIYGVADGILHNLEVSITDPAALSEVYQKSISRL